MLCSFVSNSNIFSAVISVASVLFLPLGFLYLLLFEKYKCLCVVNISLGVFQVFYFACIAKHLMTCLENF